jgi:hypothetical protein
MGRHVALIGEDGGDGEVSLFPLLQVDRREHAEKVVAVLCRWPGKDVTMNERFWALDYMFTPPPWSCYPKLEILAYESRN